jgi:hypothetical protein
MCFWKELVGSCFKIMKSLEFRKSLIFRDILVSSLKQYFCFICFFNYTIVYVKVPFYLDDDFHVFLDVLLMISLECAQMCCIFWQES